MSKTSYIKQLIERNNSSIIRRLATGVVGFGMLTSVLTSCDQIESINPGDLFTEPKFTYNQNTDKTTGIVIPPETPPANLVQFEHSDTYNHAKERWGGLWNNIMYSEKNDFLTRAIPFNFLSKQGVIYYNEEGEPRAYGHGDSFPAVESQEYIRCGAFIDTATPDYDFYLAVQYISEPVDENSSFNEDAYVATWLLKYSVDKACYQDLLLLSGDVRCNMLIQQIDEEYEPEVISKSVVNYDMLNGSQWFRNVKDGINVSTIQQQIGHPINKNYKYPIVNYVENIDYENMTITINYTSEQTQGKIYSYTYKLKESEYWDKMLIGNEFKPPISQEYRDSLTSKDIMQTYQTPQGEALDSCAVKFWTLFASDAQKATATLKYNFTPVNVAGTTQGERIDRYDKGLTSYYDVNALTAQYYKDQGLSK